MRREDIFVKSRVRSKCLSKAKRFVMQLLEIARDIAPVLVRAKEALDDSEERPSDHSHTRAETSMLYLTQKIQQTMKAIEDVYEKQPKRVKSIFGREVMTELFLSMLQEFVVVDYNKTVFV